MQGTIQPDIAKQQEKGEPPPSMSMEMWLVIEAHNQACKERFLTAIHDTERNEYILVCLDCDTIVGEVE